jgi:uncharacterized damage-inducible protein DinB
MDMLQHFHRLFAYDVWANREVLSSAYHRGQIAADLRTAGFTPAYTDFIHAVRNA